jgi:hypothetical protein
VSPAATAAVQPGACRIMRCHNNRAQGARP